MHNIINYFKFNKILFFLLLANFVSHNIVADQSVDEIIAPYLLPDNHSIKKKLDTIFNKAGILTNRQTMIRKGFSISEARSSTNLYFATHIELKGYIIKVFLDEQKGVQEWQNWIARITGANIIRDAIEKNKFQNYFKAPKKWIYKYRFAAPEGKQYILVVEDMNLVSYEKNVSYWKSLKHIHYDKLKALYTLVENEGLYDSIFIDNIPFSKDKKIAFVDTEHYHKWPVKLHRIEKYLHPINKKHWSELIAK